MGDIEINSKSFYESIQEQLKDIDTTDLSDDISLVKTEVTDEQKVYFWTRLYLKDEDPNLEIGDKVTITWTPSGETLETIFIFYGKEGLETDHLDEVTNYNTNDNKKVICLMIEEKKVNYNDDIPFIRTLFKVGRHYEDQLVKRNELTFTNDRNGIILDYYDTDF